MAENPIAIEAYRKRIKADSENRTTTVIERTSKKKNELEPNFSGPLIPPFLDRRFTTAQEIS